MRSKVPTVTDHASVAMHNMIMIQLHIQTGRKQANNSLPFRTSLGIS